VKFIKRKRSGLGDAWRHAHVTIAEGWLRPREGSSSESKYKLMFYKYRCNGDKAITLVETDERGLILRDYPVACKNDNIYTAIRSLKRLTEKLPLEERLALFFNLLELMNYEASYTELNHLLRYYLF